MTTMQDIVKMNDKELAEMIAKERETVRSYRFAAGMRDVRAVRAAKKRIAQAQTEITRRNAEAR